MAENPDNQIKGSNLEDGNEDTESTIDVSGVVKNVVVKLISEPAENVKKCDAKKSELDEDDSERSGAKESKLEESDGSEAKELELDESDSKVSEAKELELDESDGKVSEAKELELDESRGKVSEAKEPDLVVVDLKTSDAEEAKHAEGSEENSGTENVKPTSMLPEDYKKIVTGDEATPSLSTFGSKDTDLSDKPFSDCPFLFDRSSEIKSDCEDSQLPATKSFQKLNLGEISEKDISLHKIHLPEFYNLGLIGSPEASGPYVKQEGSPEDGLVSLPSSDNVKSEGGACFNWFHKVRVSPQRLMKRFKKFKSPKSSKLPEARPLISSECHADDSILSPGLSPIGSGRPFILSYMGNCSVSTMVDRIDYSKLAEDRIIPAFLGMHPCYDVMPTSGKVIVLSVELLVKNAFSALVTNEIKAAPLWDTGLHDFIGMLTISDFINVLRHYFYSNPEDIKDIENQTISTWRKMTKMSNEFIKINGSESLAQATKLLIQEGVHRIPVFDEKRKCVLFVLTRKRLLQYLSYSLFEKFEKSNIKTPSFFRKTLRELQVGTYANIATTTVDGRIIDALDLFVERKVSSLPVVDENGELKDIFEKFDVFVLAKEQTYHNLEMTVLEAITKAGNREGAVICTLDESLGTVINKFINSKVHRIVVINERRIVVGIVSLSDILKFLVVQPLVAMEDATISAAASDIIEEGAEGAVGGSDAEVSVFDCGEQDSSTSLVTEDSDKNNSLSEGITDLKISSAPENPEELDEDVPKSD